MNRKIKRLAKKAWKEKWHKEIDMNIYQDEIAGTCSFCDDATKKRYKEEGDMTNRYVVPKICCFCLLPDYICKYEKIGNNLLSIIHESIHKDNSKDFNKAVKYVVYILKALMKTGKIPEHLEKEIKKYIEDYYNV